MNEILELYFAGWAKTHEVLEHMTMKELKKLRAARHPKAIKRQERKKRDYRFDKLF